MMTIMHKEIEKCEGALTPYVTIILKEVKKMLLKIGVYLLVMECIRLLVLEWISLW